MIWPILVLFLSNEIRSVRITTNTPLHMEKISLVKQSTDNAGYIMVSTSNGTHRWTTDKLCSDNLSMLDANVMCRQMNEGMAENIVTYPMKVNPHTPMIFLNQSRCYGSESFLKDCIKSIHRKEANQCKSRSVFGLRCVRALPNLIADVESLERSVYVHTEPIYHLKCAMEENCLAQETIKKYGKWSQEQLYSITEDNQLWRKLLRFSSIIKNSGDAAFTPHLSNESWQWHSCHEHFHSMSMFAVYQIFSLTSDSLNDYKGLLLTGHKASFCLEDNVCVDGVKPYFKCSRNKSTTGNQGITPGCSDTYLHDIDCQWIDITFLPYGRYIFRLVINPQFLVGESNYYDNGIACELFYFAHYTGLHYCHFTHPLIFW